MGNDELVWILRLSRGSNEARDFFDARKSESCAARSVVRAPASFSGSGAHVSAGGNPGDESFEPPAELGGEAPTPSRVMEISRNRPSAARKERPSLARWWSTGVNRTARVPSSL